MQRAPRPSPTWLALTLLLALLLTACDTSSSSTLTPSPTANPATNTPVPPTASPTATAAPPTATTPTPTPTPEPTSTPSPTPEPNPLPQPQVPIAELEATLDALLAANTATGEYAFAVTDLQTGETVGIGLDRPHYIGCVANFFVILQATVDLQNERYEESLVGDLISRTIYSSNPVTARDLYRIAGDGNIVQGVQRTADLIEFLDLPNTTLDHPPGYRSESLGTNPNNWSTVVDANRALATLYNGDLLTQQWRDYLLAKMTEVKPGLNYLTAYGPDEPDVLVSHKNGFFPAIDGWYVDNDIGIVRFQRDGQELAYAISFFSQRVPTKYDDIPFAQRLTTATWAFFQQRYPEPPITTSPSAQSTD